MHTQMFFSHKKLKILSFVTTGMKLGDFMPSEMSDRERQILYNGCCQKQWVGEWMKCAKVIKNSNFQV